MSLLIVFLTSACVAPAATSSGKPGHSGSDTDATDTGADSGDTAADADTDTDADTDADADADADADTDSGCPAVTDKTRAAIVTDIDETLTTDDNEFLTQLYDPTHDPAMRPDANTLMQAWSTLGYRIFYVTARGDALFLLDGTPARTATTDWLADHDFPFLEQDVFLVDGLGEFGGGAADYKTGVLEDLRGYGFDLIYAYGNADTDITAYKNVNIADDHIFLVGDLAGTLGVEGISDTDAYTAHLAAFMSGVPCGY